MYIKWDFQSEKHEKLHDKKTEINSKMSKKYQNNRVLIGKSVYQGV